ncbi:MAG: metallophosphoesterase [Candidatus Bathyarchaeota archaeon]|nr:MAG: metallophosphoesterase [Candidatus Bathyarchaeota archaeon]
MLTPIKDYPAILFSNQGQKILLIADLHLGWEMGLSKKGIHVPSQMPKLRDRVVRLVSKIHPDKLLILGDVKHTITKTELGEWRDVPQFFSDLVEHIRDIQIIRGNHDGNLEPLLPPAIPVHPASGIAFGELGVFHGHTWPSKKLLKCRTLLMAHVHPTVTLFDSFGFRMMAPVWVKARIDAGELSKIYGQKQAKPWTGDKKLKKRSLGPKVCQLFVMPCFNHFLGGRPINKLSTGRKYISPLLRSKAIDLDSADVSLLDGSFLGKVDQLRTLAQ